VAIAGSWERALGRSVRIVPQEGAVHLHHRAAGAAVSEGRIRITGWLPAEQVADAFAEVEVALALMAPDPLLDSTTPTKLVEYLAMGRPVVANDHPDQSEVLRESGGGLSVPFDPDAYANAITQILEDAPRARQMADAGRQWVLANRAYDRLAIKLAAELKELTC
jgi:glycosyltransferase involved in cell wall biosynthesis